MFTLYLYMQKAKDNDIKDKILSVMEPMLIEQGAKQQQAMQGGAANSSANIQMAQNSQQSQ